MRAIASLTSLMIAGALAACAQTTGMPDIGFSDGSSDQTAVVQTETAEAPPPLPTRGPKKRLAAPARTVVASKEKPAAAAAERKEEPEESEFSLGSLAQMSILGDGGFGTAPDSVQTGATPVAAYTLVAQRIHECWLAPGTALSARHGFHADVKPGDSGAAKIIIYEKSADKKSGVPVYKVIISGSSDGSVVTTENHRLDTKLDQAFKGDLARWMKGDTTCKG